MPIATLLLREDSTTSLSLLVEKSQQKKSSSPEYDLQLNNNHLDLIRTSKPTCKISSTSTDEGFESDIDSLSIVSSDDSFTSGNLAENGSKTIETDSANGSASSDSDTECPTQKNAQSNSIVAKNSDSNGLTSKNINELNNNVESFNLVDCVCYTDVKFPDILVFVIKQEALVFKFDNLSILQNFYTNFTTLKAVTNQKAYGKNIESKFNLLQRTDVNGVTHIEITGESDRTNYINDTGPSSIISLHTPENERERSKTLNRVRDINLRQRSESKFLTENKYNTLKVSKSSSIENILNFDGANADLVNNNNLKSEGTLRKVWNSAESLLEAPKRPDRKKKVKPKAPLPPTFEKHAVAEKADVYSGQFVRVNVNFDISKSDNSRLIIKSQGNEPHPKKLQNFNLLSSKPNLTSFLKSKPQLNKYNDPKKNETNTLTRNKLVTESSWTNSVPRLLKKPRSRSETRNFTPMAYRYIDTTQNYPITYNVQPTTPRLTSNVHGFTSNSYTYPSNGHGIISGFSSSGGVFASNGHGISSSQNIGNRLFGLSPKLRDFNSGDVKNDARWGNVSELGGKEGNLKSVIKKDENKKKNEKKVTFSAYTTVQVV